ncbi:MAG TPA: tetratricopeptide repeat protein [Verrucomicrobiae bacterium]
MKQFLGIILLLSVLLVTARAQDADDRYVAIYNLIQQADTLAGAGQPEDALAAYTDALVQLQKFHSIFPTWDPAIVNYRLKDLGQKISSLKSQQPPKKVETVEASAAVPANDASARLQTQMTALQAQLQSAQAENQTLQAKLKEALATQPAMVDAGELAAAQEQIRELMKQNDLLKATQPENMIVADTNAVSQLRRQLADSAKKLTEEQARAQKLVEENTALQRNLARAGGADSSALDLLHGENDRLKSQLAALQAAANNNAAAAELSAGLKDARTQVATLQAAAALAALEKAALENRVRKLSSQLADSAANYAGQIKDLTEQRNDLLKQLASANAKNSTRKVTDAAAQIAELNKEVEILRSRINVDESKPVPYTAEELALFNQTSPATVPIKRPINELPAGSAELVASAQKHFASHEYDQAEADYRKILERDQNNGLVLANLATIELQENKLADAEKNIQAALAQSPDDAYNLSTLGYLQFRQEKYDAALDTLSRAVKIDPNNPEIENYLGVTLSHKGLRIQAETALRKAIEIDPNYAPAHNNIAVIYLNQNPPLPQLARWHYQKALAAGQPRNPELEKMLAEKGAPVEAQ